MPIKKLMQDEGRADNLPNNLDSINNPVIEDTNSINPIIEPVKPVNKIVKKPDSLTANIPKETVSKRINQNQTKNIDVAKTPDVVKVDNEAVKTPISSSYKILYPQIKPKFTYRNIIKLLLQIKPIYLIAFGSLIAGLIIVILIQTMSTKDPIEQSKEEVDVVKKLFSQHIILPENEQIDIRKITNEIEDPFFKDAEVGDYLIIFYKNRIAYIYSINKDIIINAGVVFIDPKTATTSSSTQQ